MKKEKIISRINTFLLIILLFLSIKNYNDSAKNVKNNVEKFEIENPDFIYLYDSYLTELSKYYKNLDLDNIFNEFSFMLRSGYISYGSYFELKEPELDAVKYGGIDVINGKGVCRNINCCFTDLLSKMGYDSGNMYGILESKGEISFRSNHVITWVKKDNNIYLYDVANNIKYDKVLDIYYNNEQNIIFIPSHLLTKTLNDELYLDTTLYQSLDNHDIIKIDYSYSDGYEDFENKHLKELEKEVYIKIKTLQSNKNMLK